MVRAKEFCVLINYFPCPRVLELMLQGRSNLAIVNHYKVQDLRLTLEQVRLLSFHADIGIIVTSLSSC